MSMGTSTEELDLSSYLLRAYGNGNGKADKNNSSTTGNLVLQNTVRRHFSTTRSLFGDEPMGLQLIRGENILIMGEIVRSSTQPLVTLTVFPPIL